jgi:hypothetical protein
MALVFNASRLREARWNYHFPEGFNFPDSWSASPVACALLYGKDLKGTETLDPASRDQFVLMDEAAQDVASSNTRHAGNRCVGIRQ